MPEQNLKFRKPHMTNVDGYFFMFDDDTDMLLAKTDDGSTSFSYPFDTLMSSTVLSAEHDGTNFWSMESGAADSMIIRRWRIENYTCRLKQTINLSNPSHVFSSEAFTVEHYHCSLSGTYTPGDNSIYIQGDMPGDLASGMSVSIKSSTSFETINVQHVSGNNIILSSPITGSYTDGDDLLFYNYIWMFNNADGTDTSKGALYKINAYSGSVIQKTESGAYRDIKACTFSEVDHFIEHGAVNSLMFVKASNLLFINTNTSPFSYYGSMAMDTIESNEVTIIPVYDISVKDKNLYRLQLKATYFGLTKTWSQYSYQPATFNSMVASISLTASPNVIAANKVSTSDIVARVKDQFGQPIAARLVYFEDDDVDGEMSSGDGGVNTDSNGEALSTYTSGLSARLVKIIAKVNQV
jgi:hypothetical protein